MKRAFRIVIGILVLSPLAARGDDWPMFGGRPDRNRVSSERGLPAVPDATKLRWSAEIGSQTYGNPTVSGGRVYIGTNNSAPRDPAVKGDRGVLMCFSAEDGKFLWQKAHEKLPGKEADDWPETGLSSTACVAEDRVYYVSNRAELVCVAAQDGKTLWILDMKKDLGVSPLHASVSSPLVVGDLVFVGTGNSIDHKTHKVTNPKAPSFIAVDRKTGKPVWQDNSPGDHIVGGAWGSPAYSVVDGRAQIVFPGGDGWLYSFDPPTGKPLWKFNCKSHEKPLAAGEDPTPIQLPATPVFAGHRVIIPVGVDVDTNDKGCLWAIDARKSGDITKDGALWRIEGDAFGLSIAGPTVQDGLAYAVEMAGYLDCIEVETGKTVWRHDLLATLWGGPLVADGKTLWILDMKK
ncbi:MAG TPA: PQQ-binding-like beta-propeller repeat protein, partial [Planctomycetota bacterium]|nr:PQQ-binding-like beta-propeller repeat protein [Planctomycetota bacterium]